MQDDRKLTVKCPKCGTMINETAGWFKKPGTSCPGCGLQCTSERFKRSIAAAEKLL